MGSAGSTTVRPVPVAADMTELAVSPNTPASAGRPDGSATTAPATSPALSHNHVADRDDAAGLIGDFDDIGHIGLRDEAELAAARSR